MPRHSLADLQRAFGICPDAAAQLDALMMLDWASASEVLEAAIEAIYLSRFRRQAKAA